MSGDYPAATLANLGMKREDALQAVRLAVASVDLRDDQIVSIIQALGRPDPH